MSDVLEFIAFDASSLPQTLNNFHVLLMRCNQKCVFRPITDALEIPHINERFSIVNHEAFVDLAKTFLVQVNY